MPSAELWAMKNPKLNDLLDDVLENYSGNTASTEALWVYIDLDQ